MELGVNMSKERELLKKIWEDLDGDRDNYNSLCEEIEELLAQPEPEPNMIVGYWNGYPNTYLLTADEYNRHKDNENYDAIKPYVYPLYTSPPKREQLSDAQVAELWGDKFSGKTYIVKNFARAIEKAHGIGDRMDEIDILKAKIEDLKSDNLILKQTLLQAHKEYSDKSVLTLRDHFAGLAMQGLSTIEGYTGFEFIAKDAYALADEMIAEREKDD